MEYFWPVFIIGAGLYMIFGRDKKWSRNHDYDSGFQFAGGNNAKMGPIMKIFLILLRFLEVLEKILFQKISQGAKWCVFLVEPKSI